MGMAVSCTTVHYALFLCACYSSPSGPFSASHGVCMRVSLSACVVWFLTSYHVCGLVLSNIILCMCCCGFCSVKNYRWTSVTSLFTVALLYDFFLRAFLLSVNCKGEKIPWRWFKLKQVFPAFVMLLSFLCRRLVYENWYPCFQYWILCLHSVCIILLVLCEILCMTYPICLSPVDISAVMSLQFSMTLTSGLCMHTESAMAGGDATVSEQTGWFCPHTSTACIPRPLVPPPPCPHAPFLSPLILTSWIMLTADRWTCLNVWSLCFHVL